MDQLPKALCKSICQHLFLPTVKEAYLFKGVSRETLLLLVNLAISGSNSTLCPPAPEKTHYVNIWLTFFVISGSGN